jgi:hypothetical protein
LGRDGSFLGYSSKVLPSVLRNYALMAWTWLVSSPDRPWIIIPLMSNDDLPSELLTLLRRLQADRPGSWLEDVADAVVSVGGTDSADLLAMAADRATSGIDRDTDGGDPEQALRAMEAELRADPPPLDLKDPNLDLLAHLPPVTPPAAKPPSRSMDN